MTSPMSPLTERLAEVIVPLDELEERRAVETALARLDLRRPVVYGAELRIDKRRRAIPYRDVAVLLADLDRYLVREVVVRDGEVVDATDHPGLVLPFSDDEIAEAAVLARAHPEVARAARRWGVRPAPFYPSGHGREDEQAEGRRQVGIHFLDLTDLAAVVPVVSVVVDLTVGAVESVDWHRADAEGE